MHDSSLEQRNSRHTSLDGSFQWKIERYLVVVTLILNGSCTLDYIIERVCVS